MTKEEKLQAKELTRRLREYEDFLDGKINDMRPSCFLCDYVSPPSSESGWLCEGCPLGLGGCSTGTRNDFFATISDDFVSLTIRRQVARDRYEEILKLIKKNGWQYD